MKKFDGNIVVLDLLKTYHEPGEYSFKVILNPKLFKNGHDVSIKIHDANNELIELDVRHWGRKINCIFLIDDKMPDGVYVANLSAVTDKGKKVAERFSYWVIK